MFQSAARLLMPNSKIGYNFPDANWFQYVRESIRYTPDAAKLEEYQYQLFFACGETQLGQPNHRLIEDGEYKCPGFTQTAFNYWDPDNPIWPAIPMETAGLHNSISGFPPIAKIKGELHLIRPQRFISLDTEYQNGVQFQRRRVRILVPFRALKWIHDVAIPNPEIDFIAPNSLGLTKERIVIIRAWMYIGMPEYWDKIISTYDFHSVQSFQAKNRKWCETYYHLRNLRS